MSIQHDVDSGRQARTRALKRFPALLLDRDALERFLQRAELLMPPGDISIALSVRDGETARTFPSLRDLAADPDLPTRLGNVDISVVRTEGTRITHELHLQDDDGRATLLALGDESWAYGALGMLSELMAIYARPQQLRQPASALTLNCFVCGFSLAVVLAAGLQRGLPAALAAALACGVVWFLLDMALAELRLALTPRPPKPLTIEIRSQRGDSHTRASLARLWLVMRLLTLPIWLVVGYIVLSIVVPHVPKVW